MDLTQIKEWFELLSYAATIIGIPLAIYVYYKDNLERRRIKEKEVLFTSHSLYVDYLKLCLENPGLNVYSADEKTASFSENEKKELLIFEILFTYLESAYLYYEDQSIHVKEKRWKGWKKYIEGFAAQENFRRAWNMTEGQWDEDFMKFMNAIFNSVK